jgi:Spy/CpxP family protein refolding chaperone
MNKYAPIACLFLLAAFGPWSMATAGSSQQGDPQARLRLRENISDLYLLRLTRALELTEEQTAKVYPVLTRVEKDKADLQRRMGQDLRELRAELAQSRPDGEKVLELTARIREVRRTIREKDNEAEDALDGVLTPLQKGRYLVFTVDFLRGLGEKLERARGLRAPIKRTP